MTDHVTSSFAPAQIAIDSAFAPPLIFLIVVVFAVGIIAACALVETLLSRALHRERRRSLPTPAQPVKSSSPSLVRRTAPSSARRSSATSTAAAS